LMLETPTVIVGLDADVVTCSVLAALELLKPAFKWTGNSICLLPPEMWEFIESPVPLLTGIVCDTKTANRNAKDKWSDVCVVDVNCGSVTGGESVADCLSTTAFGVCVALGSLECR